MPLEHALFLLSVSLLGGALAWSLWRIGGRVKARLGGLLGRRQAPAARQDPVLAQPEGPEGQADPDPDAVDAEAAAPNPAGSVAALQNDIADIARSLIEVSGQVSTIHSVAIAAPARDPEAEGAALADAAAPKIVAAVEARDGSVVETLGDRLGALDEAVKSIAAATSDLASAFDARLDALAAALAKPPAPDGLDQAMKELGDRTGLALDAMEARLREALSAPGGDSTATETLRDTVAAQESALGALRTEVAVLVAGQAEGVEALARIEQALAGHDASNTDTAAPQIEALLTRFSAEIREQIQDVPFEAGKAAPAPAASSPAPQRQAQEEALLRARPDLATVIERPEGRRRAGQG